MPLVEKPDLALAEKISMLDGGYPTEAELVQLVVLGSEFRLHPKFFDQQYVESKTRFYQLDTDNMKRFNRLRYAYEASMPLDVKFQILIQPDVDNHQFTTVGNSVWPSGVLEIWTVQELIDVVADRLDCDDCDEKMPDEPRLDWNDLD